MKAKFNNEFTTFGITCLVNINSKRITINSIEFAKNFKHAYSKCTSLEEILSSTNKRVFIPAILTKRYNFDLERMFNDKEFIENVFMQVADGDSNVNSKVIFKDIKALKSVEEVIREKASNQIIPDAIYTSF